MDTALGNDGASTCSRAGVSSPPEAPRGREPKYGKANGRGTLKSPYTPTDMPPVTLTADTEGLRTGVDALMTPHSITVVNSTVMTGLTSAYPEAGAESAGGIGDAPPVNVNTFPLAEDANGVGVLTDSILSRANVSRCFTNSSTPSRNDPWSQPSHGQPHQSTSALMLTVPCVGVQAKR